MKILKIDHLGVAVKSIDKGKEFWTDILGLSFEGAETVEAQKVTTAFFPVGESEVELLESTAPDGPIARYIEKKGEGIQHIAFRVENIDEALEEKELIGLDVCGIETFLLGREFPNGATDRTLERLSDFVRILLGHEAMYSRSGNGRGRTDNKVRGCL